MASSLADGFCSFCAYAVKQNKKKLKFPQVRSSQSFRDEGKRADIVEANMSSLRKRIEEMKKKENNNNKYCTCTLEGWNYKRGYDDVHNHKRAHDILYGSIQMMSFVGGSIGFVFLTGSLCIFLFSFLVNLTH